VIFLACGSESSGASWILGCILSSHFRRVYQTNSQGRVDMAKCSDAHLRKISYLVFSKVEHPPNNL
jgi:hypothetical protein